MAKVDYVEVGRKAHELAAAHGRNARTYAAKLAAAAAAEGATEEADFWKAVQAALTPRGDSTASACEATERAPA